MKISRKRQHVPGKAQQPSRGAVPLHLLIRRHGLPALGAEPQCAQLMRSAARQYMAEMMIAMRAASTGQAGVADTWPGRQPGLPGWAARACRSGRSAAAAGRAGSRCAGSAARRSGPPARPPPPAPRGTKVYGQLLHRLRARPALGLPPGPRPGPTACRPVPGQASAAWDGRHGRRPARPAWQVSWLAGRPPSWLAHRPPCQLASLAGARSCV